MLVFAQQMHLSAGREVDQRKASVQQRSPEDPLRGQQQP
jgi:hypothetical protein